MLYGKIRLLNPMDIENIKIVTKKEILDDIKIHQTNTSFFGLVSEKGKILKLRDCLYGKEKVLLLKGSSFISDAFINSDFFVVLQPNTFIVEEPQFIANINTVERKLYEGLKLKLKSSLDSTKSQYDSQKNHIHELDTLIEQTLIEKAKSLKPNSELDLHIKQLRLNRKRTHRECLVLKCRYKSLSISYSLLCNKYKDIWSYNT